MQWKSSHAAHLSAHVSGGDTDVQSIGINTEGEIELNLQSHTNALNRRLIKHTTVPTLHHTTISAPACNVQPPCNVRRFQTDAHTLHAVPRTHMIAVPVELSSNKSRGVSTLQK